MGVRMTEFIPHFRNKISVFLLLFLIFAVSLSLPINAQSKDEGKIVRVGWYDSSYNQLDPAGRRSGYAYEYQLKISAYTGWTYEYVKGSWSVLLQMLQDGDIDLMSDVSYTEKRAENMLYPSLPRTSPITLASSRIFSLLDTTVNFQVFFPIPLGA